jgi:hypothetical protein
MFYASKAPPSAGPSSFTRRAARACAVVAAGIRTTSSACRHSKHRLIRSLWRQFNSRYLDAKQLLTALHEEPLRPRLWRTDFGMNHVIQGGISSESLSVPQQPTERDHLAWERALLFGRCHWFACFSSSPSLDGERLSRVILTI